MRRISILPFALASTILFAIGAVLTGHFLTGTVGHVLGQFVQIVALLICVSLLLGWFALRRAKGVSVSKSRSEENQWDVVVELPPLNSSGGTANTQMRRYDSLDEIPENVEIEMLTSAYKNGEIGEDEFEKRVGAALEYTDSDEFAFVTVARRKGDRMWKMIKEPQGAPEKHQQQS